ncbi:MAG: Formyl-CoA transferase [Naasia sp.]|nr:Formyl-CoA transferase [Naasia sp.]
MEPQNTALEGVRVLDLTHQVAGPVCTQLLALLGADVVTVVPSGGGTAVVDPYLTGFAKRSIALDLKTDAGRGRLLELAARADVLVENFAPGVVRRLGLAYEDVAAVNADIIYAQCKGFAEDGPYADFACFDPIAQAYGGSSSVTGEAGGAPVKPGPDLGDTGTGMLLANAILAALLQRARTGEGQRIQIAMTDQIAVSLRVHYGLAITSGADTPRSGNGAPFGIRVAPSGIFPTPPFGPNDYVHIHVGNDKHFRALLAALRREDVLEDPRMATLQTRSATDVADSIDRLVADWAARRSKTEAMEVLGRAGVPAAAVRGTSEVLGDGDLLRRGIFREVDHPHYGRITAPAYPAQLSNSRIVFEAPHPPGSDTDEVFAEWLT